MKFPKFYEFIPHILAYLADGVVHANREIYSSVAELAKLSEEQHRVILPNGKRAVYLDRIGRGLTYLKLWGAVDSPRRGQQVISEKGAELVLQYPQGFLAEVVAEIVRTARKAGTQPNTKENPFKRLKTTLTLLLMLLKVPPKSLLLRVSLNWSRCLRTIFWSACVCSLLVLSSTSGGCSAGYGVRRQ